MTIDPSTGTDSDDALRRHQRIAAYVILNRRTADDGLELLLTRISDRGHHAGAWTLPGGGVDHGEAPREAARREVLEETGLDVAVGELLDVHDSHFTGRAPDGVTEDYHGIHLIFGARLLEPSAGGNPTVVETDGTTDAVAWVPVADVREGRIETLDVVTFALDRAF